jgi:hypothetical protein
MHEVQGFIIQFNADNMSHFCMTFYTMHLYFEFLYEPIEITTKQIHKIKNKDKLSENVYELLKKSKKLMKRIEKNSFYLLSLLSKKSQNAEVSETFFLNI